MATDFASTIPLSDIPQKLRCPLCDQLAINAIRLICCGDAICESCLSKIDDTCPRCSHNPIAAEDCLPHKALRNTVKAFLKSEEKKRDKAKAAAEAAAAPPVEPPDPVPTTEGTPAPAPLSATPAEDPTSVLSAEPSVPAPEESARATAEVKEESVAPAVAEAASSDTASTDFIIDNGEQKDAGNDNDEPAPDAAATRSASAQGGHSNTVSQPDSGYPGGNGFQNPMQMMGMPNGMDFTAFNPFIVGMNPMMMAQQMAQMSQMSQMSSGMYGGFGGQFSMNDMSMNMNMNMGPGFNGGYGGGNFANGNYGGGAYGARYPRGGYNQSHRGRQSQMQYQQSLVPNTTNARANVAANAGQPHGSTPAVEKKTADKPVSATDAGDASAPATEGAAEDNAPAQDDPPEESAVSAPEAGETANVNAPQEEQQSLEQPADAAQQVPSLDDGVAETASYEPADQQQYASGMQDAYADHGMDQMSMMQNDYQMAMNNGYYNGPQFGLRGRGALRAFRGGFRGNPRGRGGFQPAFGQGAAYNNIPAIGLGVPGAPTGPKADRQREPARGRGGFPSQARAEPPALSGSHEQQRERARIEAAAEPVSGERNERQDGLNEPHEEHRQDEPRTGDYDRHDDDDSPRRRQEYSPYEERPRDEAVGHSRSRDRTPDYDDEGRSSRHEKSRHRSSRHGRDRERSRERSRRRRHRSRSPANGKDDDRDDDDDRHRSRRDKDKHRSRRDRDRDRSRDRHSSRHDRRRSPRRESTSRPAPSQRQADGPPPSAPTGPRADREQAKERPREFKIQGRANRNDPSSRRLSPDHDDHDRDPAAPASGDFDPYADARELARRERLLKEQQRRGSHHGVESDAGTRKRGYDDHDDEGADQARTGGRRKRHRRRGRREAEEDDEARAARVEKEREAARWV